MTYDNGVLTCKSDDPYYDLEESGQKPNTVRIIPTEELLMLGRCTKIQVIHAQNGPASDWGFVRDITGIFDITDGMRAAGMRGIYNKRFVMICWEPA